MGARDSKVDECYGLDSFNMGAQGGADSKRKLFEQEALPHLDAVYAVALRLVRTATTPLTWFRRQSFGPSSSFISSRRARIAGPGC